MNDGGCDPEGRFYCGSMAYDQRPGAASLYRLDPDGTTRPVLAGSRSPTGLEWSPPGSRVYYNDTAAHRVDVPRCSGQPLGSADCPYESSPAGFRTGPLSGPMIGQPRPIGVARSTTPMLTE